MSTTVILKEVPVGFCPLAARGGMTVQVCTRDTLTSEDGENFTALLEQISEHYLARLTPRPVESRIDHMAVVIRPDKTAQIFINEISMGAEVRMKIDVKPGDPVHMDSMADILTLRLEGVEVPNDAGILVMISAGWRRGVFYDFTPLAAPGETRPENELWRALASLWTNLQFQSRVSLSEDDWRAMMASNWFPFIGISAARIRDMIQSVRAGWSIDEHLGPVIDEVHGSLLRLRSLIKRSPLFDGHRVIVLKALEHFESGDYVSVASMLYPRIEGLLRGHHACVHPASGASQNALAASAATELYPRRHSSSLLLPQRFETYLRKVYFANFEPSQPAGVNRNTIAHGVSPEKDMDAKASVLAVLIIEQIAFLCGSEPSQKSPEASSVAE